MSARPFDDLTKATDQQVLVKLKGNRTISGVLKAFDVHLNLVLENAEETSCKEDGTEEKEKYPKIMVRGDSIILIAL
ncbi:MAG: LSm family protein [Candidatus Diapherotrites archaeon]|nr:LSm family protein [Candidatus Diapherotrites archaeon]